MCGNGLLSEKRGKSMIFSGLMIPFLGTTLGAGMVFFMKGSMNQKLEKMLLGFAAGVMIAASVWSLLIPSIEMTEQAGGIAWIPACVGVTFAGVLIDNTGITLSGAFALALGIAIQNFPEGAIISMPLCRLLLFPGCLCGGQGFFCC